MADNLRTVSGSGPFVKTTEQSEIHTPHTHVDSLPAVMISDQQEFPVPVSLYRQADSFGRLRVSAPSSLFDSQNQYDTNPISWDQKLVGAGSAVVHLPNESAVRLTADSASGDQVIRQTRKYMRYQPGKSFIVVCTFVMGASKTNVVKRVGYFDDNNGFFLEQAGAVVSFVMRSRVTGVVVDEAFNQADWNVDKLDGNGPSGVTLDLTKVQILLIDFQWLGAGMIRFGFNIDGSIVWCHYDKHANISPTTYMTTANLPIRYEIRNTGTAASPTNLIQICSAVASEGGYDPEIGGLAFSANRGTSTVSVTTRRPILSIRPKLTFNALVNRGWILPTHLETAAKTNAAFIEIIRGGTLTGASFSSVHGDSIAESDISATAITGGRILFSFYLPSATDYIVNEFDIPLPSNPLVLYDIDGQIQENLSIVATSLNQTAVLLASVNWTEIR